MTLFADDPDAYIVYPISDDSGQVINFTPVVKVEGFPNITATWEGAAATSRDLRIPLTGLPAGTTHRLRLVVPGDNDLLLGDVVLA